MIGDQNRLPELPPVKILIGIDTCSFLTVILQESFYESTLKSPKNLIPDKSGIENRLFSSVFMDSRLRGNDYFSICQLFRVDSSMIKKEKKAWKESVSYGEKANHQKKT